MRFYTLIPNDQLDFPSHWYTIALAALPLTADLGFELAGMANDDDAADAPLMLNEASDPTYQSPVSEATVSPNAFIWALASAAGISGILFGYDTGVISSTLVCIGSDLSSRPLSTLDKSLITSSTSLFALIASPVAGVLADYLGRKRVILLADVLFVAGALIQAFTGSVSGMIAGRSIIGLAVGAASLVVPLFVHNDTAGSDSGLTTM